MKKKIIISAFLVFTICFIFALLFYDKLYPTQIDATDLAREYVLNKDAADLKYLNKNIIVHGKVKVYYKLLGSRNVLELNSDSTLVPVFCFFLNERDEYIASGLQENQEITIKGKCTGEDSYSFVKGLKIEVSKISNY
jgi:hypothetical protein